MGTQFSKNLTIFQRTLHVLSLCLQVMKAGGRGTELGKIQIELELGSTDFQVLLSQVHLSGDFLTAHEKKMQKNICLVSCSLQWHAFVFLQCMRFGDKQNVGHYAHVFRGTGGGC